MIRLDEPTPIDAIDITVAGAPLVLDADERADVEAHWRAATAASPALWNGSAFLFEAPAIRDGVFSAIARPTDFATLLFRLRVGLPRRDTAHVFPVAAVTSRDRRLLVGRQAAGGANAGRAYPPSGSFDADDVIDGRLDPLANMRRELTEEVGLSLDDFAADPSWWAIPSGTGSIALVRRHRSRLDGDALLAVVAAAAADPHGELDRVDFVGYDAPLDLVDTVPYVPLLAGLLAADPSPEIRP